jgi:hypothetical protein
VLACRSPRQPEDAFTLFCFRHRTDSNLPMGKTMKNICRPFLLLLAITTLNQAQSDRLSQPELKAGQEFKVVATTKIGTFEKELQAATAQGYRFLRLSKAVGDFGVQGLVSRNPLTAGQAGQAAYEYKVLATNRLETITKEIEAAAAEGYEFRGISSQVKPLPFVITEMMVVMERPIGKTKRRFDYRFVIARREKTVQVELDEAVSAGFTPIEIMLGLNSTAISFLTGPEYLPTIVLARDPNHSVSSKERKEYRYLATSKARTMEKEMNQLAKDGFAFHLTSFGSITLMVRAPGEKAQRYAYQLLATRRSSTMQKELTDVGKQGLRFLGTSSGLGGIVAVMEKNLSAPGSPQYDYKFLGVLLESTTQKELNDALAADYQFIEFTRANENMLVLGKQRAPQ